MCYSLYNDRNKSRDYWLLVDCVVVCKYKVQQKTLHLGLSSTNFVRICWHCLKTQNQFPQKTRTSTLPKVLVRRSGGCHRCSLHVGGHQRGSKGSVIIIVIIVGVIGIVGTGPGARLGGHFRFDATGDMRAGVLAKVILPVEAFATLYADVFLFTSVDDDVQCQLLLTFE